MGRVVTCETRSVAHHASPSRPMTHTFPSLWRRQADRQFGGGCSRIPIQITYSAPSHPKPHDTPRDPSNPKPHISPSRKKHPKKSTSRQASPTYTCTRTPRPRSAVEHLEEHALVDVGHAVLRQRHGGGQRGVGVVPRAARGGRGGAGARPGRRRRGGGHESVRGTESAEYRKIQGWDRLGRTGVARLKWKSVECGANNGGRARFENRILKIKSRQRLDEYVPRAVLHAEVSDGRHLASTQFWTLSFTKSGRDSSESPLIGLRSTTSDHHRCVGCWLRRLLRAAKSRGFCSRFGHPPPEFEFRIPAAAPSHTRIWASGRGFIGRSSISTHQCAGHRPQQDRRGRNVTLYGRW